MTHTHQKAGVTIARPLLHAIHTATFLALFVTGLLLFVPELRSLATGGYSLAIVRVHRWAGVASIALPFALLLYLGGPVALAPPRTHTIRGLMKGAHQAVIVAMTLLFAGTGLVIWLQQPLYESIQDSARSLHDWMTYAAAALLAIHVFDVAVIGTLVRFAAGGASATKSTS